jgi:hypothetical protein
VVLECATATATAAATGTLLGHDSSRVHMRHMALCMPPRMPTA